jgi:hypothetical protein
VSVTLVDVGGDVVADGGEPGLKSPMADCLALAACAALPLPADVAVLGAGLDGELPHEYVIDRVRTLGGETAAHLGPRDAAQVMDVFGWHLSEASGILAAAARGVRGTIEVLGAGTPIEIGEHSATVFMIGAGALAKASRLCRSLAATADLAQVEAVVLSVCGRTELDVEREKAKALRSRPPVAADPRELRRRITQFEQRAAARGSDFVTIRRLAEAVGAPRGVGYEAWRTDLIAKRPQRYAPPLWSVRPRGVDEPC